ncbi:MAG: fatty acid desaturase [Rhodospirillaceae bacterium]|nr:fatty acid desaturase [Rhodospirillaceae bacterium]
MEGFIARKDICSFTEMRELSVRSDAKGLVQLGSHVGAIVAMGVVVWAVSGTWWLMIPAQVVMGVLITFLFTGLHETVHWTPFRTKWINDVVGTLLGFIVFLPFQWFRHFHFEHHRQTNLEGRDPELGEPKPGSRLAFLFYLTGLKSFWFSALRTLLLHAAGRLDDGFIPDEAARRRCVCQARCYLAGYGLIAAIAIWAGSLAPLTYWIVPMALSAWSLRLYLLAEHTLLPHTEDMLENTRTMRTNAVVRWFAWQMPYHVEHHVFPAIPFHALAATFEKITPRHQPLIGGYTAFFREYWAAVK